MSEGRESIRENSLSVSNVQAWRERLIGMVLRAMVVVGGLALAGAIYDAYVSGVIWQVPVVAGLYGLLVVISFWQRVSYHVRALGVLVLLYAVAVFNLFISGQTGDGFPFLLTLPVLAVTLYGRRGGFVALGVSLLTIALFAAFFVSGILSIPMDQLSAVDDLGSWLSRGLVFVMLALLLVLAQNFVFERLLRTLGHSREMRKELESQRTALQVEIGERTADLESRAQHLEAITAVAQQASALLEDPQSLLVRTVMLISEWFGFYHTGILLLDDTHHWAVLQAASSEGGQRMLAQGYRVRVGVEGIIGDVAARGVPSVVDDVQSDQAYVGNPYLPHTRSEMVLPLRARGEVIGVLDVQSSEPAAFGDEETRSLQVLADQIAVAISNARLFAQVQESEAEMRRVYGEMGFEAWRELLGTSWLDQRHDPRGVLESDNGVSDQAEQALYSGSIVQGQDDRWPDLAIPIKVRGDRVIGVIDARKEQEQGEWTAEERALLQSLVDQLAVTLDGARLYQDSQRRAVRERVLAEIGARMRETLDLEGVLQVAVREIGEAFDIAEVQVRMRTGSVSADRQDDSTEEEA